MFSTVAIQMTSTAPATVSINLKTLFELVKKSDQDPESVKQAVIEYLKRQRATHLNQLYFKIKINKDETDDDSDDDEADDDINTDPLLTYLHEYDTNNTRSNSGYVAMIAEIHHGIYRLPEDNIKIEEEDDDKEGEEALFDRLFMWSLLLFSGRSRDLNMIYHMWLLTKRPLACALAAKALYRELEEDRKELFMPRSLRNRLDECQTKFETWARDFLQRCYHEDKTTYLAQDLVLFQVPMFFKRNVLYFIYNTESYLLLRQPFVNDLIRDIWYQAIDPNTNWQYILCCMCFPPLLIFPFTNVIFRANNYPSIQRYRPLSDANGQAKVKAKQFTSDQLLPYRVYAENVKKYSRDENTSKTMFARLGYFYDSIMVKYYSHLIFYMAFVLLFSYFLLFDFYSSRKSLIFHMNDTSISSLTTDGNIVSRHFSVFEILLLTWIFTFPVELVYKSFKSHLFSKPAKENAKKKTLPKSEKMPRNKSNYASFLYYSLRAISFSIFYVGFALRLVLIDQCDILDDDASESRISHCFDLYEIVRILYCLCLLIFYAYLLDFLGVLEWMNSNLIVFSKMIRVLLKFIVLILVFLVPYSFIFSALMYGSQEKFELEIIKKAFKFSYWPLFGEIGSAIDSFDDLENVLGRYAMWTFFTTYIIICGLLLFNLIIAIFSVAVEEIYEKKDDLYRYSELTYLVKYSKFPVLPCPLVVFEVLWMFGLWTSRSCTRKINYSDSFHSFGIRYNAKLDQNYNKFMNKIIRKMSKSNRGNQRTISF